MSHHPTDLLLAVADARAELDAEPDGLLGGLLARHGFDALGALFAPDPLTETLDALFDGLGQYPFQTLPATGDVIEWSPVGSVLLDDLRSGNTLRGLLLSWAMGNAVVIRTDRARVPFWTGLLGRLRDHGHPLPPGRVQEHGTQADGVLLRVPDVVLLPAAQGTEDPAVPSDDLVTTTDDGDPTALRIEGAALGRCPTRLASAVWTADREASWARLPSRRVHRPGTSLPLARSRQPAADRIDAKLRYLVHNARRADHYARLPAVTKRSDLSMLPVLEKETLEAHSLPHGQGLTTAAVPSGEVLRSGASSGTPRYVAYSRSDWANMVREAVPLFYALGLSEGDRLINTLFGGALYGGLITTACELSLMPVQCYTTGQLVTAEDLLRLTGPGFAANAVLGQPALLLPLLRQAKDIRPELRLEKVVYGGTPMAESDKAWLREELGTTVISSILAANDGAQLGYQCSAMTGTRHHLCEDYNLVEVVDDAGEPVPDGTFGHLLITCLQKTEGPLIRYRIGDYGRIRLSDCACGITGPVLDYAGRADGLLKIMGRRVLHSELLDALQPFGVSRLQVEIVPEGRQETVVLRTESARSCVPEDLRAHLLRQFSKLGTATDFDAGLKVFDMRVECLAEGAISRDPVSGKFATVIDHRLESAS
ncbi:phenylacetate--CoA ligase family protein [Streptomyces sp. NEAU-sy36]|uniref:phenylacetate--CoA ligase family protein n=1 Tax=unclassified Streptomyces TaxID=2593676 RepID=UPI0015D5B50D|nr:MULTISPECIES: phenylacetate--CoA ligase family protein [unclassified Streptomyces]QLJ00580.1 phenylacetate--CoA ligase family protein [Streptomyces sp. NEAU-sy36]